MRRVTSRPRLVSDADRAFVNATIDDEIGDEGVLCLHDSLHHSGESCQKYLLNSAADLSQRINGSDMPDTPSSAVVEDDYMHTLIHSHDEDDCSLEYMSCTSRNASTGSLLDSLSKASVGIALHQHHAATATDELKTTSKRKRFSRQHYYLANPSSVSRYPRLSGGLSECFANQRAGSDRNDSGALGLADMPEENVIDVSSYLTLQEVRQLSATGAAMRKILAGKF